ncbi:hypothetical protein J2T57_001653 [Natronocella acetinitrilica]|uniref:Uncharacterized protein n=1 Tax=Natronocella acetinitrilica TaxID=414046 RepID=A0AAE3G2F7_9GAMM|nr:hypothetical protein [Natronocella acetinitrilica]MCP1674551.1 hypothetical protein [Natronocella acetinitrilica]
MSQSNPSTNFTSWCVRTSESTFWEISGGAREGAGGSILAAHAVLVEGVYPAEAARNHGVSRQAVDIALGRFLDRAAREGVLVDYTLRLGGRAPAALARAFGVSLAACRHLPTEHLPETLVALHDLEACRGAICDAESLLLAMPRAHERLDLVADALGGLDVGALAVRQHALLAEMALVSRVGYISFRAPAMTAADIKLRLRGVPARAIKVRGPRRHSPGTRIVMRYDIRLGEAVVAEYAQLMGLSRFGVEALCGALGDEESGPTADLWRARTLLRRYACVDPSRVSQTVRVAPADADAFVAAETAAGSVVFSHRYGGEVYDPKTVLSALKTLPKRGGKMPRSAAPAVDVLAGGHAYSEAGETHGVMRRAIEMFVDRLRATLEERGAPTYRLFEVRRAQPLREAA